MRRFRTAAIALASMLAFGCDWLFTVKTPDVADAAKSLQTGIEKFDAIGLKKLIDDNAELRKTVDYLQGRLNTLPSGEGVIDLSGRQLQFTVTQYTGAFKIDGYLDSEENKFWVNKGLDRKDLHFGFKFTEAYNSYIDSLPGPLRDIANRNPSDLPMSTATRLADDGSEKAFQTFLRQPGFIPRAEGATVDLNSQLGYGSLHKLVLIVTPIKTDANDKWSLRGRVVLKYSNSGEWLKQFDVGSDLCPGHNIGTPLPPVEFLLMFKRP